MSNERENFYQPLKFDDYDIAGNALRAYYDMDNKLVFVLDLAVSETKPNVLLVINPVGNRKWDDILMNDYGVDLETVRPKKDNKYQKLDIEYVGLAEYDALIDAYNNNRDLTAALDALDAFRNAASQRAATERLAAAELTAERARETMDKTQDSMTEMNNRLKVLRAKLVGQRRDIGKEPTKQSAAKILRTESQIDAINEKLGRAKKRMLSAQKRLAAAEDDADVARLMLESLENVDAPLPAAPMNTDVVSMVTAPTPMQVVPQFTEIVPYDDAEEDDFNEEPQVEDMSDEEIKPLFDKDPNILDESNAFKPIDFSAKPTDYVPPVAPAKTLPGATLAPLSFEPPVMSSEPIVEEKIQEVEKYDDVAPVPVLDSLTPVDMGGDAQIDSELMATIEPVVHVAPVVEESPKVVENVAPVNPTPMPEIAVAPVDSGFRPVSPITESEEVAPAVPVMGGGQDMPRKPTVIYYVLLVALIVLSVFTLWVYQRSANDAMPELGAKSSEPEIAVVEEVDASNDNVADSPFITLEDDVTVPEVDEVAVVDVAPVEELVVEDASVAELNEDTAAEPVVIEEEVSVEPVPVVEEEPVLVQEEVAEPVVIEELIAEPIPVIEEESEPDEVPVVTESPFISDEEVQPVMIKPVEAILAEKPSYNVSQQEKMFVAAPDYETDGPVVEYADEEMVVSSEAVCDDGSAPDANGCCAGETFADIGGGRYACCSEATGDCFDPLK